ncbi:hypothetical protein HPP92_022263 [Vanilla planifolia]|uniref:Magnesium transporter n=1 Tax=Vanilla planifolia TaxID=51239 RepID=A0A835PV11_VANPL|nr:hypothetical protein HPP92_022263 [Vanilla planifolia]
MVVNLEFIKAIVTAEEVFLLDPLAYEVLPFVEHLKRKLYLKLPSNLHESDWVDLQREGEEESELPFEFQVLEIALEFVCAYLDSSVSDLERNAYPVLDELVMTVNTNNLECVRSLKGNLTRLLARVQKVRDEIEHLLDDAEDMGQFYLTRKQIHNQQLEALVASVTSNSLVVAAPNLPRISSRARGSASIISFRSDDNNVEDLEMLLEAYFMQLEGTRNKILSVREYIDNTEDYVNIQLDNQRNELIQLQMVLSILSFAMTIHSLVVGLLAVNIPCPLYNTNNMFAPVAAGTTGGCFLIFLIILGYARWKKLLGP